MCRQSLDKFSMNIFSTIKKNIHTHYATIIVALLTTRQPLVVNKKILVSPLIAATTYILILACEYLDRVSPDAHFGVAINNLTF